MQLIAAVCIDCEPSIASLPIAMATLEGPVLPALRFDLRVAYDGSASLVAAPKRQPGERSAPGPYVQVRRGQGLRSGCTLGWDGSMLHGRMGCISGKVASMQHPGRPPQFELCRKACTWASRTLGCGADLHAAVAQALVIGGMLHVPLCASCQTATGWITSIVAAALWTGQLVSSMRNDALGTPAAPQSLLHNPLAFLVHLPAHPSQLCSSPLTPACLHPCMQAPLAAPLSPEQVRRGLQQAYTAWDVRDVLHDVSLCGER